MKPGDTIKHRVNNAHYRIISINPWGQPYCEHLETGYFRTITRPEHYRIVSDSTPDRQAPTWPTPNPTQTEET